jgi:hypothetical protein
VNVAAPLAVVVELSHPPRPLQIAGPKPPVAVGDSDSVLLPMTIKELPGARLTRVPLMVAAGPPATKVVPPMTIADEGAAVPPANDAGCPGVIVEGTSWRVVGVTRTDAAPLVDAAKTTSFVAPGLRE